MQRIKGTVYNETDDGIYDHRDGTPAMAL